MPVILVTRGSTDRVVLASKHKYYCGPGRPAKRVGGITLLELLPSKREAAGSMPSSAERKKFKGKIQSKFTHKILNNSFQVK
jgi:hypothetical protein